MIVVAPRNMHHDIYTLYRKDNPLLSVKVIDKNELFLAAYPNLKQSTLLYLLTERHFSYDFAQTYLKYVPYVNEGNTPKLKELLNIKNELLEKGYLFNNEPLKALFNNKEAEVIGYSEKDKELLNLSKQLSLKLNFKKFNQDFNDIEAYQFVRFEDEVTYVLNEIAYLLDHGVDIHDILIIRRDQEYDYYLARFAPLFGYQINLDTSPSWFETGLCVEFLKLYEQNKDIEASLEELKTLTLEDYRYDDFASEVRKNVHQELEYVSQRDYLLHKLKNSSVDKSTFNPAIKVISNPSIFENKYVFALGFTQGEFPKTNKDTAYLSDSELSSLHLLTAKEETKFDQEEIIKFLGLSNKIVLTYSLKTLKEKRCYASPIINNLNIKVISNPFKDYFYSNKALAYITADLYDLAKYYDEKGDKYYQLLDVIDIPYGTYDNSFNGVDVYTYDSELLLSYSQLNDYYGCPFKYYLARILKVDEFKENNASILGNIVHELLQYGLLDESYDIESNFLNKIEQSNIDEESKVLWKFSLKEQVVEMVKFLRKHPQYMLNPTFKFEQTLNAKLDEKTTVTGRIDKLVILDNKYAVAVDYKTGTSGDFNPEHLKYGKSSQLPTYAYLIENDKRYSSYEVSGLYINHVINNKNDMSVKEDALIPSHLRLAGKTLIDNKAFSSFDNTIAGGKSEFVKGIGINYDGTFRISKTSTAYASKDEIHQLVEEVKNKYLEAAKAIRENKFEIHPFKDGESECRYCTYKDICYVRSSQVNNIAKDKEEENE